MKKYEIYQKEKVAPLTIVEAERYYFEDDALVFCNQKNDDIVAQFNWNNISGFKIIGSDGRR